MIILDIESSGLDPRKGSLVSIGALDFINPDNRFYGECRIWEDSEINPDSLKILGLNEDALRDPLKQTPTDLLKKFLNWLSEKEDQTIAGQNPRFDIEFLNEELRRSKIEFKFGYRTVDLHTLAFTKMMELGLTIPMRNNRTDINLDTILDFCGLKMRPGAHNALEDTELEAECFSRIIFCKNLLPKYSGFPIPDSLRK